VPEWRVSKAGPAAKARAQPRGLQGGLESERAAELGRGGPGAVEEAWEAQACIGSWPGYDRGPASESERQKSVVGAGGSDEAEEAGHKGGGEETRTAAKWTCEGCWGNEREALESSQGNGSRCMRGVSVVDAWLCSISIDMGTSWDRNPGW
jgi:hypothetical protein